MHRVQFRNARDRDVIGRDNAVPYAGKVYAFFFSFDHEARMYISWHFMFKHRSESRETRLSQRRSSFCAKATFLPRNRVMQIGFLNVPFRGMDGWIIAFNEFALASKSRVAPESPGGR